LESERFGSLGIHEIEEIAVPGDDDISARGRGEIDIGGIVGVTVVGEAWGDVEEKRCGGLEREEELLDAGGDKLQFGDDLGAGGDVAKFAEEGRREVEVNGTIEDELDASAGGAGGRGEALEEGVAVEDNAGAGVHGSGPASLGAEVVFLGFEEVGELVFGHTTGAGDGAADFGEGAWRRDEEGELLCGIDINVDAGLGGFGAEVLFELWGDGKAEDHGLILANRG
jgi:hypothetical protein